MIAAIALLSALAAQEPPEPQVTATEDVRAWTVRHQGIEVLPGEDENIQILQLPIFEAAGVEIHATWAVLWMDRQRLDELREDPSPDEVSPLELPIGPTAPQDSEPLPLIPTLFERINESAFSGLVREIYLEGPIELYRAGRREGWADAVYLDAVTGHGWIANANFSARTEVSGEEATVRAQANWLRHSADGTLRADDATVTTSEFDVPRYYVRTHDLRVTPNEEDGETFLRVQLSKNTINLYDALILPLPPLDFSTDEQGNPIGLRVGDRARTGFFLTTTLNSDTGGVGRSINNLLGGDEEQYSDNLSVSASWFSSRGPFIDLGARMESPGSYWLKLYVGGVLDGGLDRGIVKVAEEDRDSVRLWTRLRSRFLLGPGEWIDVVASHQTDPAVQSEFWEGDWFGYEERETYLRWRRARDEELISATAQVRTDDFRSQVERLPEVGYDRGRATVAELGDLPLVYSTDSSAGYLRRVEGDGVQGLWQDAPFSDGLGEREVLRVDTTHRLETPFQTGLGGIRVVPFVEAGATWWDEDVTALDSATRVFGAGGVRVATTLWKLAGESLYEVVPFAEVRNVFALEEHAVPVTYDAVEVPVDGTLASLGLRTRWKNLETGNRFDLELRGTHASDRESEPDGWLPVSALAHAFTEVFGFPTEVFADHRWDIERGNTAYALTSLGLDVTDDLRLVVGHRFGRDAEGLSLFESASVAALYRWTEKWEFEAGQSFSSRNDGQDVSRITVRRFGADFVVDVEVGNRQGEGAFFDIGIRPVLGFSSRRLGAVGIEYH